MGYVPPFYADQRAIESELKRHHPVSKHRTPAEEWVVQCSCGADTGPCQEADTAVAIWTAHFMHALRNP